MYNLNFNDIRKNYKVILDYCMRNSDSFSVITSLKKPYSRIPHNYEHGDVIAAWEPYMIEEKIGVKSWPGTFTKGNHFVMIFYNSKKFRRGISILPNLFAPIENNIPEDVCFYRGNVPWLFTTSHENTAEMNNETADDLTFLLNNGIRVSEGISL